MKQANVEARRKEQINEGRVRERKGNDGERMEERKEGGR